MANYSSFGMGGVSHPSQHYAVELLEPNRVRGLGKQLNYITTGKEIVMVKHLRKWVWVFTQEMVGSTIG